ncbi:MAG: AEC family transporter [Hyphomicrobiaceae bacterium]
MSAVFNATVPIFALILVGYLAGRAKMFDMNGTDTLNRFAFYFALPALIFVVMSKVTPEQLGHYGFAAAFGLGIAVTYALGHFIATARGKPLADASLDALDGAYGNTGFMGIPLCLLALGQESMPPAVIATLFTACILFLFGLIMIERGVQPADERGKIARKTARALLRNPLFIAPILGLTFGVTGMPLWTPLERFASFLGAAASPTALFCIGLFLAQIPIGQTDMRSLGTLVSLKLLFQPALTTGLVLFVFDMPKVWSASAVLLSSLPIGSGPFTIAKTYGLDAGPTAGAILASHLISVLTLSLIIAWLA